MKRLILLTPLFLVASCAKYPEGGTTSQYPRITFSMQLRGEVNDASTDYGDGNALTQNLYFVAIRAITTEELPNTYAPSPVIGDNTPNGFVAGAPTHYVQYTSDLPSQSFPYRLFRFNPGPTENDPDNPINLGSPVDTTRDVGPIVRFVRPRDAANRNTLEFDLFLNQLATPEIPVENIKRIQVNLLTMNRLSTFGSGTRIWDALGNSGSPSEILTTVNLDVRTNQIVSNNSAGGEIEPVDDVQGGANDPSVDIQSFSIEVRQP